MPSSSSSSSPPADAFHCSSRPHPILHLFSCLLVRIVNPIFLSASFSTAETKKTKRNLNLFTSEMASRELWRRSVSAMRRPFQYPAAAPASLHQAKRGLAVERPEDSSTSNWGTGEPPIDEKATKRGVGADTSSDSDGEVPTPNLSRQKSTRDFINSKREERMKAAEEGTSPEVKRQQQVHEEVKETGAAHPGDMAGG